jgi:META domain
LPAASSSGAADRPRLSLQLVETSMVSLRPPFALAALCIAAASLWPALASDLAFPFDRELMLDAAPMHGSKRIPIIEIAADGAASIDLWCSSLRGKASVGADSLTIVPEGAPTAQCAPERQSSDENLLAALVQVTNWRRHGDVIEFIGARTLRFHLMTD